METSYAPTAAEVSRQKLIRMLEILETTAEPAFDALTRAASYICQCPISLMSLIDTDRQWFKSAVGVTVSETPIEQAFCAHAIEQDGLFEVEDALKDPRFRDNPLVAGGIGIRYYAGQPILFQGVALGTLCVIDRVPRCLDRDQKAALAQLSIAMAELLNGRMEAKLHRQEAQRLRATARLSGDWLWESDAHQRCTWLSSPDPEASGLFENAMPHARFRDAEVLDWAGRRRTGPHLRTLMQSGLPFRQAVIATTTSKGKRFIALAGEPVRDATGLLTGYRGYAQDVSDRIEAELLMRDRERTLDKIAGQLPGVVYQYRRFSDGSSCFPYTSDRLQDVFETNPADVVYDSTPVLSKVHPDDRADVSASIARSRETGSIWHSRFRVCLPLKGTRWIEGTSAPEDLADGSTRWHGYFNDVTELQARDRELSEANASLRNSERRLRALTDNLPALISHVDAEQRYTFANSRSTGTLGGRGELLGRTVREVHGEAVYADIAPHIARVLAGEHVSFEGCVDVAGDQRHYQATYVPDVTPDGRVRGFYAMCFDVTDRKRAEMRVASSERLLRGVTDNLPALVSYIDCDKTYRFANATYQSWLGQDHRAMVGRHVRDYFDPESSSLIRPYFARAWNGERVQYERHDTGSGRDMHHLVDYIPDLDDEGKVLGLYVMSTDVTRIKQAEAARAESEQRLRDITDNLPVLIAHADADQRVTYANDTYLSWMGLTREELQGRTIVETIGAVMYAQRKTSIERALAGERVTIELRSMLRGTEKHLRATYVPDIRADGRVAGITMLSVDVTDLKLAEQRLSILAHTDSLTGLPNRLQFAERLEATFANGASDGILRAVMFLDIDHFKSINDVHGHAVGDAVLTRFAARVRHSVRPDDFVARLAGDEFVVLLDRIDSAAEAEQIARVIVENLGRPFRLSGQTLDVTASVGIAMSASSHQIPSELMARADAALYSAKDAGRNTFRLAA